MTKTRGQTILNKELRLKVLEAHLAHAESKGIEYTKDKLLHLLRIAGYNISLATLYNDIEDLARNDTFIEDLAAKTYSSIMHTCFNRYQKIYKLAMAIHDSEIAIERTIQKETDKGSFTDVITERNSATAKAQALTVAKNANDSIRLMVNGENIRTSASKWVQVSKQQEATIANLREKLKQYEQPAAPQLN